jgi:GTPase-activating protein BEM2
LFVLMAPLLQDLFVTADLLEVQTADRSGWLPSREPNAHEDTVEVQTIYSQLLEVEASSMISELSQDALFRLLPPSIRGCVRAYSVCRKWLISKIVCLKLGNRLRQERMDLLLRAIQLARMRSIAGAASINETLSDRPCIRSFAEAVLTAAVVSVESRMYARAWYSVALARGAPACDSLAALVALPSPVAQTTPRSGTDLTIDVGWILERMLELISIPDVVDSQSPEGQPLVNFDKRRYRNPLSQIPSFFLTPYRRRQQSHLYPGHFSCDIFRKSTNRQSKGPRAVEQF